MSSQTKTPETLTPAARAAQLSISAQGQAAQSAGNKLSASDARARLAMATERPGNAAADLRVGDELDGSTMVLPVDAIQTYDRNPRLRENPKYLSIKESVRAQGGVTNQLTVTKRPGDASSPTSPAAASDANPASPLSASIPTPARKAASAMRRSASSLPPLKR